MTFLKFEADLVFNIILQHLAKLCFLNHTQRLFGTISKKKYRAPFEKPSERLNGRVLRA